METLLVIVSMYIGFFLACCLVSFHFDGDIEDGAIFSVYIGILGLVAFGLPAGLWWLIYG